ncbi:hypothetical protein QHH11_11835 [Aphanizomenon sp. PH219]|nr:hypothetical protein [Aphanizomenon sp. 202]MDK2459817.1 hypothetical protein [Aphanizomenon sp. PH219]
MQRQAVEELENLSKNSPFLNKQYYCQFSKICLKSNKIVTISIRFQGFGNSIALGNKFRVKRIGGEQPRDQTIFFA